jgi:hypothetical protein
VSPTLVLVFFCEAIQGIFNKAVAAAVAQVSKPAVSPISKSAGLEWSGGLRV